MHYRSIAATDIPSLFTVRIATWHNPDAERELAELDITPESVRAMLHDTYRGWLCETDGQVSGFCMANRENGELWVIAVLPQFEGRGIGRKLMNLAEQWLAEAGWKEAWLTTFVDESSRAVGFYRKLGWQDWKIADDRYMRKRLDRHFNTSG